MKVLLSGGVKTENILNGIKKKFESSGEEFIIVPFFEDIEAIFAKGDYFDKAIIAEQSITREFTIQDEAEIRKRVNDFANLSAKHTNKESFVFITKDETLANIISEEIFAINSKSVVILKEPPYAVSFFTEIIVTDIMSMPSNLVFKPKTVVVDSMRNVGDIDNDLDDLTFDSDVNIKKAPDNFDDITEIEKDLDDLFISEELATDTGVGEQFVDNTTTDADNSESNNKENGDSTEYTGVENEYNDNTDEDMAMPDDMYGDDQVLELEEIKPAPKSKNMKDYTQGKNMPSASEIFNDGDEVNDETVTPEKVFLPGLDDDYEDEVDSNFNQDLYSTDAGEVQHIEENEYNEEEYEDYNDETYETDVYSNDEFDELAGIDEGNDTLDGFDNDMYGEDDADEAEEEQDSEPNLYGDDMYDDNEEVEEPEEQQPEPQVITNVQPSKKKGLLKRKNKNETINNNLNVMQPQSVSGMQTQNNANYIDPDAVRAALKPFSARGNSIVVTGCGGMGASCISYNLANIINQLGYTVLLVDMDTECKTQSYISRQNYDSIDIEGANLVAAINSSSGLQTNECVVKNGFHLLTMGLGADSAQIQDLIHKEKIARFANMAKSSANFVIYDVPFDSAIGYLDDVTYMCDNLVVVVDSSNWGVTKTLVKVCNIANEDMQRVVFDKAQLVFNRYRNLNKVFGKKVKTCRDITKVMDEEVITLTGNDPGLHFQELHIAGIINDDPDNEMAWFEPTAYSDTRKGQDIYMKLIMDIVLRG